MDALGFFDTKPETHDLTTPRGRLLYLRDVVVPGIKPEQLNMDLWECGTHRCLAGWAARHPALVDAGLRSNFHYRRSPDDRDFGHTALRNFFGLSWQQEAHMFFSDAFDSGNAPTHAELTQHINDVLDGRV